MENKNLSRQASERSENTKQKPTAEEIMAKIENYGKWEREVGAYWEDEAGKEPLRISQELLSQIRTAITELVNNQK